MRESAAGPIGTGMLLAMLGFGLVCRDVPFPRRRQLVGPAARRLEDRLRRARVRRGWLALGVEFLFLSLSVLIVMGVRAAGRRLVVDPGQPCFRRPGDALRLHLALPHDRCGEDRGRAPGRRRPAPRADPGRRGHRSARGGRRPRTSAANAYATGIGPTRKVFPGARCSTAASATRRSAVTAHEFGHHSQKHLPRRSPGTRSSPLSGALGDRSHHAAAGRDESPRGRAAVAARARRPDARSQPLQNVISAKDGGGLEALEATRDSDAMAGLFKRFSTTSLGDPTPPGWAYVILGPILRCSTGSRWRRHGPSAQSGADPLFGDR